MPDYGPSPIAEVNSLLMGLCYIRIEKSTTTGIVTSKQYWNHAIEAWESGPRVDSKHVLPYQRLNVDVADAEYKCQLGMFADRAFDSPNVLAVTFIVDAAGKVTETYSCMTRVQAMLMAGITW